MGICFIRSLEILHLARRMGKGSKGWFVATTTCPPFRAHLSLLLHQADMDISCLQKIALSITIWVVK